MQHSFAFRLPTASMIGLIIYIMLLHIAGCFVIPDSHQPTNDLKTSVIQTQKGSLGSASGQAVGATARKVPVRVLSSGAICGIVLGSTAGSVLLFYFLAMLYQIGSRNDDA